MFFVSIYVKALFEFTQWHLNLRHYDVMLIKDNLRC